MHAQCIALRVRALADDVSKPVVSIADLDVPVLVPLWTSICVFSAASMSSSQNPNLWQFAMAASSFGLSSVNARVARMSMTTFLSSTENS